MSGGGAAGGSAAGGSAAARRPLQPGGWHMPWGPPRHDRIEYSASLLAEYCTDPANFGRVLWEFTDPSSVDPNPSSPHTAAFYEVLQAINNFQLPDDLHVVGIPQVLAAMHNNPKKDKRFSQQDTDYPLGIKLLRVQVVSDKDLLDIHNKLLDKRGANKDFKIVYHGAPKAAISDIIDKGMGHNWALISEAGAHAFGVGAYAAANVNLEIDEQGFSITGVYSAPDDSGVKQALICLTRTGPVEEGTLQQKDFKGNLFLRNRSGTIICAENPLYIAPAILILYTSSKAGPVQMDGLVTYEDEKGTLWKFPHLVPPMLNRHRNGPASGLQAPSEYKKMQPYHLFNDQYLKAVTWYIERNPDSDIRMVFGTCQSSRDIVDKLARFMEQEPKKYSGIRNMMQEMQRFITDHKVEFDQFEHDKRCFDKLIDQFKAKKQAVRARVPAIIIDDDLSADDADDAPGRKTHVAGFSTGELFSYLDLGNDKSSLNWGRGSPSISEYRVHDVVFEVVAVAPSLRNKARGHEYAARLRMDMIEPTTKRLYTLTKFVEQEQVKRETGHYRPNLVKNWRKPKRQQYYKQHNIKDDKGYYTIDKYLYVVFEDEMVLYIDDAEPALPIPPPPPSPPAAAGGGRA
jgi:hypothetical protein